MARRQPNGKRPDGECAQGCRARHWSPVVRSSGRHSMKTDEHSGVDSSQARSGPTDRLLRAASWRASELLGPDPRAGAAREGKATKHVWRREVLARFRARGARLYATLRPRAGRILPKELCADNVSHLAETLPLGVRDPGFERLLCRIEMSPIHHGKRGMVPVGAPVDTAGGEPRSG